MKNNFVQKIANSGLSWLWLVAAALITDQFSKHLVRSTMGFHDYSRITANLNIRFVENPGAAFSFLANGAKWQVISLTAFNLFMIGLLLLWLKRSAFDRILYNCAVSLILAGAIGNLLDRLQFGAVTDFIDLHIHGYHWPTFNFADVAICLGVMLLLFESKTKESL